MKTTQLNGVKLVPKELLENIPELYFFNDKGVLDNYQENIKKYGEKARKTLTYDGFPSYNEKRKLVVGSSPFINIELGKLVRLATPSELEQAVRNSPDFFRGTYEDTGFMLQTNGDSYKPNDYVAKELYEQIKKRNIKLPVRISLKGLDVEEDNNSAYSLVPIITDATELFHSPEFSHKNNGKTFSETDENGVPIWDKNGNRTFYAREGLSGLSLDDDLGLGSDWDGLADSGSNGRVALVSGEATSQNLEKYLARLQEERKSEIAKFEERYKKAEKFLRTGKQ